MTAILAQADTSDDDLLNEELTMTASITVIEMENLGRADALPADEYPNYEIVEELDDATCDLCEELDGQIIGVDHPDFEELQDPSHINCRRIIVAIGADEVAPDGDPIEPNYERPSSDLIQEYGHFMVDREKYAELRIPAQPEGRDFIVTPYVDDQGLRHARLNWRVPPYDLSAPG
jgi:SPP1 gp7 family putative phage head morphogenesis protein